MIFHFRPKTQYMSFLSVWRGLTEYRTDGNIPSNTVTVFKDALLSYLFSFPVRMRYTTISIFFCLVQYISHLCILIHTHVLYKPFNMCAEHKAYALICIYSLSVKHLGFFEIILSNIIQ